MPADLQKSIEKIIFNKLIRVCLILPISVLYNGFNSSIETNTQ